MAKKLSTGTAALHKKWEAENAAHEAELAAVMRETGYDRAGAHEVWWERKVAQEIRKEAQERGVSEDTIRAERRAKHEQRQAEQKQASDRERTEQATRDTEKQAAQEQAIRKIQSE